MQLKIFIKLKRQHPFPFPFLQLPSMLLQLKSFSSLLLLRKTKLIQHDFQRFFILNMKFSNRAYLPVLALLCKMGSNFHTAVKSYLQLILFFTLLVF